MGPAIQPNWATLHARERTPEPITAVIIWATAVQEVPAQEREEEIEILFLSPTKKKKKMAINIKNLLKQWDKLFEIKLKSTLFFFFLPDEIEVKLPKFSYFQHLDTKIHNHHSNSQFQLKEETEYPLKGFEKHNNINTGKKNLVGKFKWHKGIKKRI